MKQVLWRNKILHFISLILASLFILVLFSIFLGKMLSSDLSLENSLSYSHPDPNSELYHYHPGVYLISYADGPEVFFKNQNVLALSALNKGIDFIWNYRKSHIPLEFYGKHSKILKEKKGAGFWLWKPWIILNTLEHIPENAILIYSDTGLAFRNPITELIDISTKNDIILFEYDPLEKWGLPINIAKREVFIALECDEEKCHRGRHVWAGILILRNTENSRAFIKQWLTYCTNEKIITDSFDPSIDQHPEFDSHYHDEAILNVMYNKNPDLIFLYPSRDLFLKYATWHHRHPVVEHYSLSMALLYDRQSFMYKLQNEFLNNIVTINLRKWFKSLQEKS